MNYLAHAYCSFNHPEWMVGNLISDFIKGKNQYLYPCEIQKGIRLHRAIDAFTDTHNATRMAKEYFRPHYRLYAGAFVDVIYDHFLANDSAQFEDAASLLRFANSAYDALLQHYDVLPPQFQPMYHKMRQQNWLYNYRERWGIEKSFGGVVYRSRYLTESAVAFELFNKHYDELSACYNAFFPDLLQRLHEWYRQQEIEASQN